MKEQAAVARIYEKAIDIVLERGLCKGVYEAADGRVCSSGAINLACGGNAGDPMAQYRAKVTKHRRSLQIASAPNHLRLVNFNDKISTTKEDVVTFLSLLAHDARKYWNKGK